MKDFYQNLYALFFPILNFKSLNWLEMFLVVCNQG